MDHGERRGSTAALLAGGHRCLRAASGSASILVGGEASAPSRLTDDGDATFIARLRGWLGYDRVYR
jgi:hypothetical protein